MHNSQLAEYTNMEKQKQTEQNYKQIHQNTDIGIITSSPTQQQTTTTQQTNNSITSNQITRLFVHVPSTYTIPKLVYCPSSLALISFQLINH